MANQGSKAARGIRANIKPLKLKTNLSGMVQNKSETFLRPDQALDIVNMHAVEEGSWSADLTGYTRTSDTAYESGAVVNGLRKYTDSSGVDHLFIAINGKLKEISTVDGTVSDIDASAGYSLTGQVDFEQLNNILFTVDGTIDPRTWDGTTAADATGWPVDDGTQTYAEPKFVEIHQNRVVFLNFQGGTDSLGASTSWPSHFIISDLDDGQTFTLNLAPVSGAYIGQAQSGAADGPEIVGARSMHIPASNETQLVIFKESGTYTLLGKSASLTDADVFKVIKMNGTYGAINNRCIIDYGNDILALNEFGVTSYSSSNQSGTIQPTAINSDHVKDVIARLNKSQKAKCWGIHLPERREIWFFLPTGSSTYCNEAIVYKYPSPGDTAELPKWSRRTDAGNKFLTTHGIQFAGSFYVGLHNGFVGQMFTSSKYHDVAIPWVYEYPYIDFGYEKQNKRVPYAEAQFKVRTANTATIKSKWLGGGCNDVLSQPLAIMTNVEGAKFGSVKFGAGTKFGSVDELKVPFEIPGDGQRLKLRLSGNTAVGSGPEFLGLITQVEFGNLSQHWS